MELWNNSDPSSFEDNDTDDIVGSYRPVSYDLRQDACYITVNVNIDAQIAGVPFYLSGSYLTYSGVIANSDPQFSTSSGDCAITMKVAPDWSSQTFPWALVGNIIWKLEISPTTQVCNLNSSRLELYALTPSLPSFFNNQIKVAVLRAIVYPARQTAETDWVYYFIKAAMNNFNLQFYDGSTAFTDNSAGGNYNLQKWCSLVKQTTLVNDWDQAGILQIGIGLGLSGATTWKYISPFGYIIKTKLIGVGDCNNPYCKRDNTDAVIGNNDSKRTQFSNHTFVTVSSKSDYVGDATIGPHTANEAIKDYVSNSIQTKDETTLYSSTGTSPGTSSDASDRSGITSIDSNSSSSTASARAPLTTSGAFVNPSATRNLSDVFQFTNANINELHNIFSQAKNRGGDLLYHAHDITPAGSHIEWVFGTRGGLTTIQIHITDSNDGAKNQLRKHFERYPQSPDEIFQPAPIDIAKGSICFVSKPTAGNLQSEMIWIRGNIFASVTGNADIRALDAKYISPVDKVFVDGAQPPERRGGAWLLQRPIVDEIKVPKQVRIGEEFMAYASVGYDNHIFLVLTTLIAHRSVIPTYQMY